MGTPVCGRNLGEITTQFIGDGLDLSGCYDRLEAPLEWLGADRVRRAAENGLARNLAAYGRQPASGDLERVLAAWLNDGRVDFARLDEPMQEEVLARVVRQRAQAALISPCRLPEPTVLAGALAMNRSILHRQYTLARYGERLERIYQQVAGASTTPCDQLDGRVLLDRFLAPERLYLLRVD